MKNYVHFLIYTLFILCTHTHTHTHTLQPQVLNIIERAEIKNLLFRSSMEEALRLAEGMFMEIIVKLLYMHL